MNPVPQMKNGQNCPFSFAPRAFHEKSGQEAPKILSIVAVASIFRNAMATASTGMVASGARL
jgi:hypothetical protein